MSALTSGSPCKALKKYSTEARIKECAPLATFTEIHICICDEVEKNPSEALRRLNANFCARFAKVCEGVVSTRDADLMSVPAPWVYAIEDCFENPQNSTNLLKLAKVHILVDLRASLCEELVDEQEFDSLHKVIGKCMGIVWKNLSELIKQELLLWIAKTMGPAVHLTVAMPAMRLVRTWIYHQAKRDREENRCHPLS